MSLIEGLLIFLSILCIYFLLVMLLQKKGILEKYKISFFGPALLLRTKKGRNFLKKIAEKKRFWKAFGSLSIVFCFIMMVILVVAFIFNTWAVLGFTPEEVEKLPGIEYALVLPGINPILPLEYIGYIILALIVAIIVHEFSHGILTFASKLKVKSLGILYLIVPLGAFCEPDEEEIKKTKTKDRMRIYAVGPMANFVVVFISILLFSFVFMSAVQPAADGLEIFYVAKSSPAENTGLSPGMIITDINGTKITNYNEFFYALENTSANQTVSISFVRKETTYNKNVTLADKYNYTNNQSHLGSGYLGVAPNPFIDYLPILKNPFNNFPSNFLLFYIVPLLSIDGYNPIFSPFTDAYVITGPLGAIPDNVFWAIVNSLYWIFWLNLAVALFNVLPIVPLDGGFMFNDAIRSFIKRVKNDLSDEKREKIVKNTSMVVSITVLLLVIFPFLIKYF